LYKNQLLNSILTIAVLYDIFYFDSYRIECEGSDKMKVIKEKVHELIKNIKNECEAAEDKLKKDNRADEALIEKIRGNIADIFLTVFEVSYKQTEAAGGDTQMLINKFSDFFIKIPAPWRASLDDAKEEDDFETIYKEEAKLAMAERIQTEFKKITDAAIGRSAGE
jgi:hypothetical protein